MLVMNEEGGLLTSSSGSLCLLLGSLFSPNASSCWENSPLSRGLAAPALSRLRWTLDLAKGKKNTNPSLYLPVVWRETCPSAAALTTRFWAAEEGEFG